MPDKIVVFDVGAVLIDWNPDYLYRKLIIDDAERAHFFENVCTREWNVLQDGGRTWADGVAERIAKFPGHADLIRAYDTRWTEMISGAVHDVVAIKAELRAQGIPTYAITNFSSEKWVIAQENYPFLKEFDGVIVSGDEKLLKPDPRIYHVLLNRYGLDAASCFFIDDVPANIEAAKAVGMAGHVFTNAADLRKSLNVFLGTAS